MLTPADIARALDAKIKPLGSLGRLETLAAQIAAFQGALTPRMEACTLTVFAGDHGVAEEGVSAYPSAVTAQMRDALLAGGAGAAVLARALGVGLVVVDAGVNGAKSADPRCLDRRIAAGTRNFLQEPAMDAAERDAAIAAGRAIGAASPGEAAAFGEVGIGNTSAAALIIHKLTGAPLEHLVGRGAGLDDAGLAHKHEVLRRAAARTAPRLSPGGALAEYGGFEIVMMAGAMIGAAEAGKLVLVDGAIAGAAALAACGLAPALRPALIFAHRSAEPCAAVALEAFEAEPLLDLGLRLGEGTGALLAWPLVKAAAAMLREMATFETAGVSGPA